MAQSFVKKRSSTRTTALLYLYRVPHLTIQHVNSSLGCWSQHASFGRVHGSCALEGSRGYGRLQELMRDHLNAMTLAICAPWRVAKALSALPKGSPGAW